MITRPARSRPSEVITASISASRRTWAVIGSVVSALIPGIGAARTDRARKRSSSGIHSPFHFPFVHRSPNFRCGVVYSCAISYVESLLSKLRTEDRSGTPAYIAAATFSAASLIVRNSSRMS